MMGEPPLFGSVKDRVTCPALKVVVTIAPLVDDVEIRTVIPAPTYDEDAVDDATTKVGVSGMVYVGTGGIDTGAGIGPVPVFVNTNVVSPSPTLFVA
jgi:hypothetical protein